MNEDGIHTTTIGSMPKPDYLKIPSFVEKGKENKNFLEEYIELSKKYSEQELYAQIRAATQEAIRIQSECGITIGADGEMRRVEYMYGICRSLTGFDFEHPKVHTVRNGNWTGKMPKIVSTIGLKPVAERSEPRDEWQMAQDLSNIPIKFTIPGPFSICDTMLNEFYEDEEIMMSDLVKCLNYFIIGLVEQGCKHIQIDAAVLARNPEKALKFGIQNLKRCFEGVPNDVAKIVHICCGYPSHLDQTDYVKAAPEGYMKLAEALDNAGFDMISIEDAHRRNDINLFKLFKKTTIILGVVDVVRSRIETVDEITQHVKEVLPYIPKERLILAPDCGLIFLPSDIIKQKLSNMVQAAKHF